MSAGGVKQVISIECSGGSEPVDQPQPASGNLAHADRDRTVQQHDRRRINLGEFVVERGDLRPITGNLPKGWMASTSEVCGVTGPRV
jgi:hypothetical protein